MTEQWFTEDQVKQVAKDVYDYNASCFEAASDVLTVSWGDLSQEHQQKWFDKARTQLAAVVPLDLSRPLRLRDGTPVSGTRLSDDGLCIIADIAAWGSSATWPRDGKVDGEDDPTALVYVDQAPE